MSERKDLVEAAEYLVGLTLYPPDAQIIPAAMSHVKVTLPLAATMQQCIAELASSLTQLRAALAAALTSASGVPVVTDADKLADLLREAAYDIECYVRDDYGYPDVHPAIQRKYERDIAIVSQLRTAAQTLTAASEGASDV